MHYFLSAGEASGDLHAAQLITALKSIDSDARFTFLGGDEMARAAGHAPVIHYQRMAYMGFVEVLKHLKTVLGNLKTARNALQSARSDRLILVDYPSFNLRLARTAVRLGIPIYWYISPKVWAWKERRVEKFRQLDIKILSILPFEPKWFSEHHGMKVMYVGNPSLQEVERRKRSLVPREEICRRLGIEPSEKLLLLAPGSRKAEIKSNLPVMEAAARRHPEFKAVVAAAPGVAPDFYDRLTALPRLEGVTFDLMAYAEAAMVTSGTATLECALLTTPQVVCYRANGSRLVYNIFKRLLKVRFVSLPNLIVDREIVPEMLLHHCNPDEVDAALSPLLGETTERAAQLAGYDDMSAALDPALDAPAEAARIIAARPKGV